MRRLLVLGIVVFAVVLGGQHYWTLAVPPAISVPAAPVDAAPPVGLQELEFGDVAEFRDRSGAWTMRVVVDSAELDPPGCEFPTVSGRAHRVVLALRVETSEAYDPVLGEGPPDFAEWATVSAVDGVTEASPRISRSCRLDAEELPREFRSAARYRGEVVVETGNPAGQLVLADRFVWAYPALRG